MKERSQLETYAGEKPAENREMWKRIIYVKKMTMNQSISDQTNTYSIFECGSSVVERWTRNQVSPGSNPALLLFRRLGIFVLSIDSALNEYLAIDSGGNVSDMVLARNCCLAIMLPGEADNGV